MSKYNYQEGGTILGKGTYGLIIHPSLTCGNIDYSNNENFVSKIIDNADLTSEYTAIISSGALDIVSIDPTYKYFLYPISKCVDISDIQDRDLSYLKKYLSSKERGDIRIPIKSLSNKSDVIDTLNDYYSNIIMPKGEFDLSKKLNVSKIPLNNLKNGIINIILATKKLKQSSIAHRDIKPLNIIYHHDNLKLIDFGLAIKNRADNIWNDDLMKTLYMYWSLDYKIIEQFWLSITTKKPTKLYIPSVVNKTEMPKIMKSIMILINEHFKDMNYYHIDTDKLFSKSAVLVELTNLLTRMIKLYDKNMNNKVDIMNIYAPCVYYLDTFSLAISIYEISEDSKFSKATKLIINETLKKYLNMSFSNRGKLSELLVDMCNIFISLGTDIKHFEREITTIFGEDVFSQINVE